MALKKISSWIRQNSVIERQKVIITSFFLSFSNFLNESVSHHCFCTISREQNRNDEVHRHQLALIAVYHEVVDVLVRHHVQNQNLDRVLDHVRKLVIYAAVVDDAVRAVVLEHTVQTDVAAEGEFITIDQLV